VNQVTEFARELREYLKTNKPEFITNVMTEKQLSDASEAMLKAAIQEVTASMLASA
jgi:F-type H+-transporting ATPase subunit alpha